MSSAPRSAPEPERRTPGELIALGSELESVFDRLARRQGNVTLVQFRVLDALTAHDPEPLEPWEIAQQLTMGSNHVSMLLDQLASRGLVERRPHPHDRRRRLVQVTPVGRETAVALGAHVAALEERIMEAALSPAERRQLAVVARNLRRAVAAMRIPDTHQRPGP